MVIIETAEMLRNEADKQKARRCKYKLEYHKKYYEDNKERAREYGRLYYAKNKIDLRIKKLAYYYKYLRNDEEYKKRARERNEQWISIPENRIRKLEQQRIRDRKNSKKRNAKARRRYRIKRRQRAKI